MRSLIKLIEKTYRMADPLEGKTVLHNAALLSGLQTVTYLLPIVILPYLFQIIGPERFGLISFAQAFVQYFVILTDYGFNITATKEISLCQNEHVQVCKVFSSVMTVKIILAILSLLILGAIVHFVPKFQNDWMVYMFSFGVVAGNTLFPVWFFQGTEKMKYIAQLNIIGEFAYAAFIFIFIKGPQDYLMVPVISSSVFLTTGLLGQYIVFRTFKMSFKLPGYKNLRQQLDAGWNLFVSIVAINAYTTTRVFAVGLLTNNTLTGLYSIAERIANVVQTFPLSSFTQAIFPRLSKMFQKNKIKAFAMMRQIQLITINIALICLPLIFLAAPLIVRVVCGGDYPQAALSLRLLIVSIFFISANAFRVQFLLVCGKTHTYSKIHVGMAIIGLPLIIIFIDLFSYVGAALATVAIEAGIFSLTYVAIKKLKWS